jgi:hypothetical protein
LRRRHHVVGGDQARIAHAVTESRVPKFVSGAHAHARHGDATLTADDLFADHRLLARLARDRDIGNSRALNGRGRAGRRRGAPDQKSGSHDSRDSETSDVAN